MCVRQSPKDSLCPLLCLLLKMQTSCQNGEKIVSDEVNKCGKMPK